MGLSAGEINLPKNAKIGKTLEGKALQEVLQKVANSKKGGGREKYFKSNYRFATRPFYF
ncbi:hypothetical protein [uncultured Helicobacter sp.]|uniref:hypothetical protein n=1 Tax=uncultured Helicobacter sp. TaxID=175537 RepID=UPI00260D7ACB|nr:hypothetical protein [uncultured Helicobacter sp.]